MSPETRARVIVAEDHPLFLEGIVRSLGARPELDVVGTTEDGTEAWDKTRELVPDVLCLDMRLPGMSGLDVLRAIRRDELPIRVVILSGETTGDLVFEAVRLGVDGYVTKDSSRNEVADAVVAVARGATVFSPVVQQVLASEVRGRSQDDDLPVLSPREREVLRLIADGLTGPAIGRELHIGAATVKTHTQNIYDKLGVAERAAAVAQAMRRGLLD